MLILITVAIFVVFAVWMTRTRKRMSQDLDVFMKEHQFAPSRDCPPELLVQGGSSPYHETQCLRGSLRPNLQASLILRTSYLRNPNTIADPEESMRVTEQAHRFIGFYFSPSARLDDAWIERWKAQLTKPVPKPERTLVTVERTKDGGVFLDWKVYHNYYAAWLNAVLQDLLATLPQS